MVSERASAPAPVGASALRGRSAKLQDGPRERPSPPLQPVTAGTLRARGQLDGGTPASPTAGGGRPQVVCRSFAPSKAAPGLRPARRRRCRIHPRPCAGFVRLGDRWPRFGAASRLPDTRCRAGRLRRGLRPSPCRLRGSAISFSRWRMVGKPKLSERCAFVTVAYLCLLPIAHGTQFAKRVKV